VSPGVRFRVLVLCTGNSARSQVAEALFATRGGARIEAASAGAHPAARVNPLAVETLARHGIAWEGKRPRGVDAVAGDKWDLVITVCDNADRDCPVVPGTGARVHWGMPDPHTAADFAATWERLDRQVTALLAMPLETMGPEELRRRAQAIHT
jgi:protein-tyrosine-phosphatase